MDEKVFISYSRKDTDWADRIKAALESNGISCWMDRAGIKAGEKYTREIINAIKRCDVFLLVLSPNAEQSEWVPKELGKAIQYHKYIIPVKITDFEVEEFELQLENIQIFKLDSLSEIQSQINLVNTVKDVLRLKPADHQPCAQISDEPSRTSKKTSSPLTSPAGSSAGQKKNFLIGGLLAVVLAVGILSGWFLLGKKNLDTSAVPESQTMVSAGNEAENSDNGKSGSKENELSEKTGEATSGQAEDQPDKDGGETQSPWENAGDSSIPSDAGTDLCTLQVMNSAYAKITENAVNSAGQTFDLAVTAKSRFNASLATFYLGSGYSRFVGTLSCPDNISDANSWRFLVWLDDKKDQPVVDITMSRSTPPTLLDLDVTGHNTITFWAEKKEWYTGFMVSDATLYGPEDPLPEILDVDRTIPADSGELTAQHLMNYTKAEIRKDAVNTAGQTFPQAVVVKGRFSQNFTTFYLGDNFTRFIGTLSCPNDLSYDGTYAFKIWLDDEKDQPMVDMTMSRSTPPTLLDLDVTGHDTITFWTEKSDHYTGFMISDAWLYRSTDQIPEPLSAGNPTSAEDTDLAS